MAGQLAGPDDPELAELTERFVRVRLIQMGGVDLATFQFDPFLSWSVFFMNGDKTIYGRYGSAHPQTKRSVKDSNPNHSVDGLKAALTRALEIHEGHSKDPEAWAPRLAGKTGPAPRWRFAGKTPAARKYKRVERVQTGVEEGCIHCHEIQRMAIDSHFMKKLDLPDNMLWLYPRPHVLGLALDKDHAARVTRVKAGSAAAEAGVEKGDDLLSLGGQPLVSVADLQWVLHQFPDEGGTLEAQVKRSGESVTLPLKLPAGWRRTEDFGWRYRVAGYASWLWAGVSFEDRPNGIFVANKAPNWFKKPNNAAKSKLRRGDVIIAVDGKSGFDRSELLAYLMREKKLGSKVKLEVLRGGKTVDLSFKLPKKQPEVLGY